MHAKPCLILLNIRNQGHRNICTWLGRQRILACLNASGHGAQLTPFAAPAHKAPPVSSIQTTSRTPGADPSLRVPLLDGDSLSQQGESTASLPGSRPSHTEKPQQSEASQRQHAHSSASDARMSAPSQQHRQRPSHPQRRGQEVTDMQQEPGAAAQQARTSGIAGHRGDGDAGAAGGTSCSPASSAPQQQAGRADQGGAASARPQQAHSRAQQAGADPETDHHAGPSRAALSRKREHGGHSLPQAMDAAMSLTFSGGFGLDQVCAWCRGGTGTV